MTEDFCNACQGTGVSYEGYCSRCNGFGKKVECEKCNGTGENQNV